jgi:hypothetical protein
MPEETFVFYSWQSDLPKKTNRNAIEHALKKAVKELGRDAGPKVIPTLDRDTKGEPGSPDITRSIFRKIRRARVFVADVSIINRDAATHCQATAFSEHVRYTPNPNVLIELGYAVRKLGWERVILVVNEHFGHVEQLPFNLNHHRPLTYSFGPADATAPARQVLVRGLTEALRPLLGQVKPYPGLSITAVLSDISDASGIAELRKGWASFRFNGTLELASTKTVQDLKLVLFSKLPLEAVGGYSAFGRTEKTENQATYVSNDPIHPGEPGRHFTWAVRAPADLLAGTLPNDNLQFEFQLWISAHDMHLRKFRLTFDREDIIRRTAKTAQPAD